MKEKGVEIVRILDEEESLRDEQTKLENKLMQIEDAICVWEWGPDKQGEQGTKEGEIKIEFDEYKGDIAREACRKAQEEEVQEEELNKNEENPYNIKNTGKGKVWIL